jgi:hypothetical protein
MPIRAFLEGRKFDSETIRLMGIGFELTLAALWLADKDFANEVVAREIIALAQAGERDPERMCENVLHCGCIHSPWLARPPKSALSTHPLELTPPPSGP